MLRILSIILCFVVYSQAVEVDEFFSKGKYDLKLRLSYEYSDLKNSNVSPGKGLTLSSYIGYRTAELEGFSLYAQFHNLWKIDDHYNDLRAKYAGDYDEIADPDGSRLQQLYGDFTQIPDTKIRLGRQELLLDDVRFIGNIGWRQTAQAFDAVTLTNKSIKDTTIFLGYSESVATILFKENEYDGFFLGNIKYGGIEGHTQTLFAYLVDADEKERYVGPSVRHDVATYGTRFTGGFDALKYDLTYAYQTDWKDTENLNHHFFQGALSYTMGKWTPAIGYSYIDGADQPGERAFSTLFSTAHKYNGWADQFLSTNAGGLANGLQDFNVSLTYKNWGTTFKFIYHYFDTTEDHTFGSAYGQEFDFLVTRKFGKNLTATAKVAFYDEFSSAGNPTTDEIVFWLRLDYALSGTIEDVF